MAKYVALTRIEYGVAGDGGAETERKVFQPGDDVSGLPDELLESLKAGGSAVTERSFARLMPELLEGDEEEDLPVRFTPAAQARLEATKEQNEAVGAEADYSQLDGLTTEGKPAGAVDESTRTAEATRQTTKAQREAR